MQMYSDRYELQYAVYTVPYRAHLHLPRRLHATYCTWAATEMVCVGDTVFVTERHRGATLHFTESVLKAQFQLWLSST